MFRARRTTSAAAAGLSLAVALACGDNQKGASSITGNGPPTGLAACTSPQFLTVPLLSLSSISSIVPLGNLNPPSHTFPTDHIYFYMSTSSTIAAPGAVVVTNVVVQHRTGGGQPNVDDYLVTFFPCADVMLELEHVKSLSVSLSAKVGPIDGFCQPSYVTGGFTNQQCSKSTNVALAAGEAIGVAAGSLDLLARDRRITIGWVNPTRLSDPTGEYGDKHIACPIDYFVASIADQYRAKLGPPGAIRTVAPVCGEVMLDVPGSASGRWFVPGAPTYPEDVHLALAHDNINPATAAFSVGTSIPTLPSGVYSFTPATSGRVNLDFRFVTIIGETECYTASNNRRVLLQLTSATRIRIQGFGTGACGDPSTWVMDAGAVEFER